MTTIQEYLDKQASLMQKNYDALVAEGRDTIYVREIIQGTFLEEMYDDETKRNCGWMVRRRTKNE